jgi:DNA-binding transcriptional LysR family regulator
VGILKDSSLKAKKIGSVKSIFVVTPGFLERYGQVEDLEQLSKLPFLGMGTAAKIEALRDSDSKKFSVKANTVFSANNPAMLMAMALTGRGVAFIPEFLCREHLRTGRLVHVLKNLRSQEIPLSLVTPDQKEVPLKLRKFLDLAHKKLKEAF